MSAVVHAHPQSGPALGVTDSGKKRRALPDAGDRGRWGRFTAILVITAIVLVPIMVTVVLAFTPGPNSTATGLTFENVASVFSGTLAATWLQNSLVTTLSTVVVAVAVAAPAGYVQSRGRSKAVSGYSLLLFVMQSLPIITSVVPLFILFAGMGLVDNLLGITIIYVGSTMTVATWMMAAYFGSLPISFEEASWIDGCSVFGSFTKVVLRNSLPGILSTAILPSCWRGTTTWWPLCSCARTKSSRIGGSLAGR